MLRDGEHLPGANHQFLAINPELERAVKDVGDLLVVVAVLWDDAALLQQHAGQHHVFADDEVTLEERIQVLQFDRIPRDVLQLGFGLSGRWLAGRLGL